MKYIKKDIDTTGWNSQHYSHPVFADEFRWTYSWWFRKAWQLWLISMLIYWLD